MGEEFTSTDLERPVHTLKSSTLRDIGAMLSASCLGKDGHYLSGKLGYNQQQYDQFVTQDTTNPAYEMLRHWATNNGSTVRVLRNKLRELERDDVITHLANSMRATTSLTVVVKGPPYQEPKELNVNMVHPDTSLGDAIRGPLMDHFRLGLEQVKPHDGRSRPPWERPCVEFEAKQLTLTITSHTLQRADVRPKENRPTTDPVERRMQAPERQPLPARQSEPNKHRYGVQINSGFLDIAECPPGGAVDHYPGPQDDYEVLRFEEPETSGSGAVQRFDQPNQTLGSYPPQQRFDQFQQISGSFIQSPDNTRREREDDERTEYCDLDYDAMNIHLSSTPVRSTLNHYVNHDAPRLSCRAPRPEGGSRESPGGIQDDDGDDYDDVIPPCQTDGVLLRQNYPSRTQGDRLCHVYSNDDSDIYLTTHQNEAYHSRATTKDKAKAILGRYHATDNCYITRPSSAGQMGISVTYKGAVKHYRIEARNTGNDVCLYVVGRGKLSKTFTSMTELFEYYSVHPLEDEGMSGPILSFPISPAQMAA